MNSDNPESKQESNIGQQLTYDPNKKFSATNQPSGETKSAGWWRKKKGRLLLRHLLELDFDGTMTDPKTGEIVENKTKRDVARYMNVPIESVTVEMVIFVKQIAVAIQKNDLGAANMVIDNAYGKPKETFQMFDDKKPEIVFQLMDGSKLDGMEMPPILESEEEEKPDEEIKPETNEQEIANQTD